MAAWKRCSALRRAPADVTMIDRQNYHCFQPLLYQVATAALSPADVAWPIRHILRDQANVTVLMENVTGVDTREKRVRTDHGEIAYDYLCSRPARGIPISATMTGRLRAGPQAHRGRDPHSPQHPARLRARRDHARRGRAKSGC